MWISVSTILSLWLLGHVQTVRCHFLHLTHMPSVRLSVLWGRRIIYFSSLFILNAPLSLTWKMMKVVFLVNYSDGKKLR